MTSHSEESPMAEASGVNSRITKKTLQALAPLPATALRLLALLDDPNVSLREVADVSVRDVGISATMLRMANSAMFGLRGRVGSISDALRVIGTMQARLLVLASGVSEAARKELPIYELAAGSFLRHSELVGNLTMFIAREVGYADIGSAYSAGLLHDIGKVVINGFARQQSDSGEVTSIAGELEASTGNLRDLERHLYGKSHSEVGKELAEMWNLPAEIVHAIEFHHATELAATPEFSLARCVILANVAACKIDPSYPQLNQATEVWFPDMIEEETVLASAKQFLAEVSSAK